MLANIETEQQSGAGRAGMGTEPSPSPLRSNAFGLSGISGDNSRNTVSPSRGDGSESGSGRADMSREAEARFILLKTRRRDLNDQMLAKSVKLGGKVFKSRAEVKSWLAINACAAPSYIYFMDVHSLMALRVRPQLDDAAADADFESKARKVGYVNTDEAHVASSFRGASRLSLGSQLRLRRKSSRPSRPRKLGNLGRWWMEQGLCLTERWTTLIRNCKA